ETCDLVLLDMNMPGMDGRETFRRIRALHGPGAAVPVIAMTANAMDVHRRTYLRHGVNGFLAKPITPARIEAELFGVLQ
ncbi:MAG: response regulator, partial [Paracoccaceae bacterium]|nr:response regulator [Paracoccaceae bacterium]